MTDFEDAPKVSLGGQEWPVPQLAIKQNKIIDPLILSLLPVFTQWQTNKAAALTQIKTEQYDALEKICFVAIRRASPELKIEEFENLPVTLPEMIAAFSVIAQQTGIFQKGGGEGEAAGAESPRTGTQ